jgi:DNA polymerase-3 subunit delta'
MAFEALIGQPQLKTLLERAWHADRMASAWLFHGEEALGAGCAALELARLLLCETRQHPVPCGRCPGCLKMAVLDHPDLYLAFALPAVPAGKSDENPQEVFQEEVLAERMALVANPWHLPEVKGATQFSIAQARHLKRWAGLRSFMGGYRVVVVFQAQEMGLPAQNALLKLLEEPPPRMVMILCADRPDSLLPTIVSRCQQMRLRPMDETELALALAERKEAAGRSPEELADMARRSDGLPGLALRRLIQPEAEVPVADFLRDVIRKDLAPVLKTLAGLESAKDREAVARLIRSSQAWLQDARLLEVAGPAGADLIRHRGEREALEAFSARLTVADPGGLEEELDHILHLLERNVYLYSILITFVQALRTHIVPRPAPRGPQDAGAGEPAVSQTGQRPERTQ